MKTCPYCAEEIQDAAIKCRWCQSWLVEDVPAGADRPASKPEGKAQSSRVDAKPVPKAEEPKAEEPKLAEPKAEEPKPAEPKVEEPKPAPAPQATMMAPVPEAKPEPAPEPAPAVQPTPQPQGAPPAQAQPAQAAPAAQAATPSQEPKIEFTHTGSRYLLGYAPDFFGIWDRNAPEQPVERFPRNDDGWGAAWARYAQIETNWMDLRTGQKSG